jgi:hypothetical protein
MRLTEVITSPAPTKADEAMKRVRSVRAGIIILPLAAVVSAFMLTVRFGSRCEERSVFPVVTPGIREALAQTSYAGCGRTNTGAIQGANANGTDVGIFRPAPQPAPAPERVLRPAPYTTGTQMFPGRNVRLRIRVYCPLGDVVEGYSYAPNVPVLDANWYQPALNRPLYQSWPVNGQAFGPMLCRGHHSIFLDRNLQPQYCAGQLRLRGPSFEVVWQNYHGRVDNSLTGQVVRNWVGQRQGISYTPPACPPGVPRQY